MLSQLKLINNTVPFFKVSVEDIGLFEAHGTQTLLVDLLPVDVGPGALAPAEVTDEHAGREVPEEARVERAEERVVDAHLGARDCEGAVVHGAHLGLALHEPHVVQVVLVLQHLLLPQDRVVAAQAVQRDCEFAFVFLDCVLLLLACKGYLVYFQDIFS